MKGGEMDQEQSEVSEWTSEQAMARFEGACNDYSDNTDGLHNTFESLKLVQGWFKMPDSKP